MELLSTANLGSIRQRQGGTGLPVNGRRRMHIRNQTENLTRSLPPLAAAAFYQELRLTSLILQDLRLRKLSSLVQSRLFKVATMHAVASQPESALTLSKH